MLRLVFLLAGAILVLNAAKALGYADDGCLEECSDDDSTGHCPPGCADCVCCAHLASAVPMVHSSVRLAPSVPAPLLVNLDKMPSSPDPRELLHVPKSSRV